MGSVATFGEILEAADKLSLDEQESLKDVLNRRLIERRREELPKSIQEARKDYKDGSYKIVTPKELMKEISS